MPQRAGNPARPRAAAWLIRLTVGLGLAALQAAPLPASANCNLIPAAPDEFRSFSGTVSNTTVSPGNPLRVRVDLACSPGARGFEPVAASNQVVLRFVPPGSGADPGLVTDVPIAPGAVIVSNCGLGGGRCDTLRFDVPDAATLDAALPPAGDGLGLSGPAEVIVRAPDTTVIAHVGTLFDPTLACNEQQPEPVFGQLTVLPEPNSFADLASGAQTSVRATLDGGGNLLVPLDYSGVLPSGAGSALFRILQATADVDAFTAQPGLPIRVPAATYVRAFSLSGRPIPPVLEIDSNGALILGSVDAQFSILRVSRLDPFTGAGPPLYDFTDRFSQGGRGPIVIGGVTASAGESAPLSSLAADAEGITFARSEALDSADLNADGDQFDRVAQVVEVATGAGFPTGLALTDVSTSTYAKPALATGDGLAAFAASEARQDYTTLNGDGDAFDGLLRVFDTAGVERTAALPQTPVDPSPEVEGDPIAISNGLVFFRTREADASPRTIELLTPVLQSPPQRGDSQSPSVSRDGRYVAFDSFGGPTFFPGAPSGNHIYVLDRQTGAYELISRDDGGTPLQLTNFSPRISADGNVVAFHSRDEAFPGADDGGFADVFVFQRDTTTLSCISCSLPGFVDFVADDVSGDGRYVLVNGVQLYDRQNSTWTYVPGETPPPFGLEWNYLGGRGSLSDDAQVVAVELTAEFAPGFGSGTAFQGVIALHRSDGAAFWCGPGTGAPNVSADGRVVALQSTVDLTTDDNNLAVDAFTASTRGCGDTERVSIDTEGRETSGGISVRESVLSDDGRYVAYVFDASGLVPGSPSSRQVYRYDRTTNVTEAISTNGGVFGDGFSNNIAISGDGRVVAFSSFALNLDPGAYDVQNVFVKAETTGPSLNAADTDTGDTVLQVFDAAAQPPALRPLARVPAQAVAVDAGRAAFLSSEAADGGIPRNGDGDAADLVARVYDGVANQLRELGVAANRIDIAGDTVCLTVPEAGEPNPAFRNADADTSDDVLAIWSVSAGGTPTSLGVSAVAVEAAPGRCVFATSESDEGGAILNGDGDALDTILQMHDGTTLTSTGLAVVDFVVGGGLAAFRVPEYAQGSAVLNGDGESSDEVMHLLDLASGQVTNTGRAAVPCGISGCDPFFEPYRVTANAVSFLTRELDQGSNFLTAQIGPGCARTPSPGECDLNDDLDGIDLVITVYGVKSGAAQVVTLAQDGSAPLPQEAPPFPVEQSGKTVLQLVVPESTTGTDVNGDGQITDAPVLLLIGDVDNDGALDTDSTGKRDLCVETSNPEQLDADRDRLGDGTCDPAPTQALPGDVPCDVNLDQVIDAADVTLVFGDRGMTARASDPRDPDGDGTVTILDVSLCSRTCTYPDCASAPPAPAPGACGLLGAEALPLLGVLWLWSRRGRRADAEKGALS